MNISISNIAWDIDQDDLIRQIMSNYGVQLVDIAPSKYFDDFNLTTVEQIKSVKRQWNSQNIKPYGMQSLFFGTSGLNIFGNQESQENAILHLSSVFRIASILGIKILVFGSPKNRDRGSLSNSEALSIAVEFFQHLGYIANLSNLIVCLEPNPKSYGCNFMTNTQETATIVRLINRSEIKMQCDIGAIIKNRENLDDVLTNNDDIIGFVHLSEPDLEPLEKNAEKHHYIALCLKRYIPEITVSIEMLTLRNQFRLSTIENSIKIATSFYR